MSAIINLPATFCQSGEPGGGSSSRRWRGSRSKTEPGRRGQQKRNEPWEKGKYNSQARAGARAGADAWKAAGEAGADRGTGAAAAAAVVEGVAIAGD